MCSIEQFEVLFVKYRRQLFRLARKQLGGCAADADDVVHNAFLRGHDYLRSGKTIVDPYKFLCATVRNLVYDGYRRMKIRRSDSTIDVPDVPAGSDASSVEQTVMSEREMDKVCDAINRLPARVKRVIVLRMVYGHSYQEIAALMGTRAATAKRQGAAALKRIKADLSPQNQSKEVGVRDARARRVSELVPVREND